MTSVLKFLPAATLAVGLALSAAPAIAQQPAPAQPTAAAAPAQPKASPAAIAAAKEILQIKNAGAMYAGAVPGLVEKTKIALIQQNLNYQKDLNEVAQIVAQQLNGRQNEIGEGMAQV
jgi:hypothetical protein